MTDQTNRNETERFGLSPAELDRLFERTTAGLVADVEARRCAVEWPSVIERLLGLIWRRSEAHQAALASIEVRLAAIEATSGMRQG